MLILYLAAKYDYGVQARGLGFEHFNFYESLKRLGHDILYFDFPTLTEKYGFDAMSRRFEEVVRAHKPALTFCVLTGDQVNRRMMRRISDSGITKTVNWYCDDHFNFDSFSSRWTPCFNWVVTTAQCTLPKYEKLGLTNVIKSQWGCNPFIYHPLGLPLKYDVSFVGARHGNRPLFVEALRRAGVKVDCWGSGWNSGRLSQEEMIAVFNQSRINLNFTNGASMPNPLTEWRLRMKNSWFGRMENSTVGMAIKKPLKALRKRSGTVPGATVVEGESAGSATQVDLTTLVPDGIRQIKGRTFEVPGCGGFLMSSNAENLTDYLANDREAATFESAADLVSRVKFYLADEEKRAAVAAAGHARTMNEHTYVHRLRDVFEKVGMPAVDVAAVLSGQVVERATEMVT